MKEHSCELLVVGSGPGGYVCAIRAGQLGIDTIIVEADLPGGTCLNVGCIPSKALIHAADEFDKLAAISRSNPLGISAGPPSLDLSQTIAWKDGIVRKLNSGVAGLLKNADVKMVTGNARFLDGKTVRVDGADGEVKIHTNNVVIATGSEPVEIPGLPFGDTVVSSTGVLALTELPGKLVVVGAGYIGLELGIALRKLGSEVTIIEADKQILPQYDAELAAPVLSRLKSLGITLLTGARAKSLSADGEALLVETDNGKEQSFDVDKVLVAVGRQPRTSGWGREELVIDLDGPFVRIDNQCKTNMRGIYAIGDVTGEPMLAHRAMAQGEMVAELVAGQRRQWDKTCIAAVCFTDPEVVSAGMSPGDADEQGLQTVIGSFPFKASGRAMATERDDGFVRIVARADNHLVLGIQGVGAGISELSAEMALAIEMGARLEDLAATIHAHPTRSEAIAEAAMSALGHGLHSVSR